MPIFGLRGGDFAGPYQAPQGVELAKAAGGRVEPGPLFWRARAAGYTDSLAFDDGADAELLRDATVGVGRLASPGHDVAYMKVRGYHGAGSTAKPTVPSATPEKISQMRMRFALQHF